MLVFSALKERRHFVQRCPHFRGWYVQASMELGPEDVSLLERCPHFREWYIQASMELGPEDVSLLDIEVLIIRTTYVLLITCLHHNYQYSDQQTSLLNIPETHIKATFC